jgi:predicted DNA-binding transcriptional regulator AlpA
MARESAAQASFGWAGEATSPSRAEEHVSPRAVADSRAPVVTNTRVERTSPPSCETPLPPENELWDVRAAAKFLKRSVSWVYHKAEDGTLPVRRLDGWGVRFVPAELRAWVVERGAGQGRRR